MSAVMGPCGRCGENEATVQDFGAIIAHAGTGTPYCERCVVEVQLDHATERAAVIPELTERLAALGGRATREVCGYVRYWLDGDRIGPNTFCTLDKGHDGYHSEEPA